MKRIFLFFAVLALMVGINGSVDAQSNLQASQPKAQNTDKPLRVKKKPQPSARGCQSGGGRMSIRVTFDKSGVVTDVATINASGCGPFDRSAIVAAKKIEFEPAEKDGVPITVTKVVEYKYSIY